MRFALKEMRRRPGRFAAAALILTFVSLLIVYLGGVIDGTVAAGTGALRAQSAGLLVFGKESQLSIPDSRIDAELRDRIAAAVDGVATVDGLGVAPLAGRLPDSGPRDLLNVSVIGYERANRRVPVPPAAGTAYADATLRRSGVRTGTVVEVGPMRTPLRVVGFVDDTTFDGQSTLWVQIDTWRAVQAANKPARDPGAAGVQILLVTANGSNDGLAARIDAATGATRTVTPDQAVAGLPGVEGTRSVFTAVIGFTTLIGIVVVALLFALLVVERVGLYGVLKALGVPSVRLFGALATQALVIAVLAGALGTGLGVGLGRIATSGNSAAVFTIDRIVLSLLLVCVASVLGAAITLRRVLRIDPAAAIGSAQ